MSPEVQKRDISGPIKRTCVLQKLKIKTTNISSRPHKIVAWSPKDLPNAHKEFSVLPWCHCKGIWLIHQKRRCLCMWQGESYGSNAQGWLHDTCSEGLYKWPHNSVHLCVKGCHIGKPLHTHNSLKYQTPIAVRLSFWRAKEILKIWSKRVM